ncbi:protein SGT1 homolog isoform X2 [Oncorhynchus masou masou]|uniref:protein SGT1 homolog isoform X2 n=1 Tax=Oncorhynchus masou masou TaxID=90313 RepID=UPI00318358F8
MLPSQRDTAWMQTPHIKGGLQLEHEAAAFHCPPTQHLQGPLHKDQYPSSSASSRKWDKVVGDISEEEKLEGHAALNKLFQQIYCDGTDKVESGGTVLSTNWTDVGKRTIEMSPPDDMELKKY